MAEYVPIHMNVLFPVDTVIEVRVQQGDLYFWVIGVVKERLTSWTTDMIGSTLYLIYFPFPDFPNSPWVFPDITPIRPLQIEMADEVFEEDEEIEFFVNGGVWALGWIEKVFLENYAIVRSAGYFDNPGLCRVRKRIV